MRVRMPSGQGAAKTATTDPLLLHRVPALLVCDIDGTLVRAGRSAQPGLAKLRRILSQREGRFAFAVATGRSLTEVREVFARFELPQPDAIICRVGTEVHYALDGSHPDHAWQRHLAVGWDESAVRGAMQEVAGITPQPAASQGRFKVSYSVNGAFRLDAVLAALGRLRPRVNVVFSEHRNLDLLPHHASKWQAVRHLCGRWSIRLGTVCACGDSGNDFDMLAQARRAVVVGNHSAELEVLRSRQTLYFSLQIAAAGVLDGLRHWEFP